MQATNEQNGNQRRPPLGVILLTVFIDLVGFSIIFPLLPEMLDHYLGLEGETGLLGGLLEVLRAAANPSGDQADLYTQVLFGGVLGSLYSLLQFLAAPIWGTISDRIGRRRVLMFTTVGMAVAYGMWAMAGTFLVLVLSRLVGGLMGGNISVATAAIADVTDARNRTKAMGMLGASFGLGFIVGPAIGGGLAGIDLTQTMSWLPGVNPFTAPALAALVLAIWNVVWVVTKFPETLSDGSREQSHRARRPLNPAALLRPTAIPGLDRTNLIYFLYILGFAGMEFTLTFLARDRFGYTSQDNVWIFLYVGLLMALVQGGVVRRLAPKVGEKPLLWAGLLLVIPGLAILGIAGAPVWMYVGLGLLGVGGALANPSLTGLASLYSPEQRQGELLGVFRSLGSLGRAVGPLLAASLYWRWGSQWSYFGGALLLALPLLLSRKLPTVKR
ncbi:MAG: MFS transporter [Nannocystaceae bacterium]